MFADPHRKHGFETPHLLIPQQSAGHCLILSAIKDAFTATVARNRYTSPATLRRRHTTTTSSVMAPTNGHIDKLDFPSPDERRPLLQSNGGPSGEPSPGRSNTTSCSGSFFEQIAEGIQERDRARMAREVVRYLSFVVAVVNWYDSPHIPWSRRKKRKRKVEANRAV